MNEERYCTDCLSRLTYFEGSKVYYCWFCQERFDKNVTFDIGDLESYAQGIEKAKQERENKDENKKSK
jgi:hypothetical protein